jgi:hypothetical protein
MNWIELRPILRERFGPHSFYFYNDIYKTKNRRIKISCYSIRQEMYDFIKSLDVSIDVNFYKSYYLTIHYKK